MSVIPKFFGKIDNNKILLLDGQKEALNAYLRKWPDGKEIEMTVKAKYKNRTSGQPGEDTNFNGYLWGVLYKIIADEMGEFDLDYIHYWMQIKVGNVIVMKGEQLPKGTSDMSGAEFSEYCMKVRVWAGMPGNIAEHGMFMPLPGEAVNEYEDK